MVQVGIEKQRLPIPINFLTQLSTLGIFDPHPMRHLQRRIGWEDDGEWLSPVEHLLWEQGVVGSNPISPTNKNKELRHYGVTPYLCLMTKL